MAVEFNLLSGASIDNELRLKYDILRSGESYLGFGREHETWGQGALVRWKARAGQNWPEDVIGDAVNAQIYDDSHRLLNISADGTTAVHVARLMYKTEGALNDPLYNPNFIDVPASATDNRLDWLTNSNRGIVSGMSNIECIFINEKWMMLRGINPTYDFILNNPADETIHYKYFIFNFEKNMANLIEIDNVSEFQYPGLDVTVSLKYNDPGNLDITNANIVPGAANLRRRFNLNGEYVITGLNNEMITWFEDPANEAKNYVYFVVDAQGALLVDAIQFEETVVYKDELTYIFSYVVEDEFNTRKVRFKLTTSENINDRAAVFKESLPFETHISPIADNNPPGLPISYVRSLDIHESIFDVVGLHQITQQEVWMAYELPGPYPIDASNPLDPVTREMNPKYYEIYDLMTYYSNADMISIQTLDIDTDLISGAEITKQYAVSKDLSLAATLNFNLILVDIAINNLQGTSDVYRQIFISWKPKKYNGLTNSFEPCTASDYDGRENFFHPVVHKVDMGTLFYLANKMPVYRKYLEGTENFKIIL